MKSIDKYDWRTKNHMLWVGAAMLLLVCYLLALKPTWRLRQTYIGLQAGEQIREANARRLAELRAEVEATGSVLDEGEEAYQKRPEPERVAIIAQQRQVAVRSLPKPQTFGTGAWKVDYSTYQLEGGFRKLLVLLDDVEQQRDINLLNASFVKQTNPATRFEELVLLLRTVRLTANRKQDSI